MKICLVSDRLPGFHQPWSGAELICWRLSQLLRETGQDVFLLTTGFTEKRKSPEWISTAELPLQKAGPLLTLLVFNPLATLNCYQILKRKKPDIVHLHAVGLFLPALIAAKALQIPTVMTVLDHLIFCPYLSLRKPDGSICTAYHGIQCSDCGRPTRNPLRILARKIRGCWRSVIYDYFVRRLDGIIVLSKTSKLRLERSGVPGDRIRVIYHYQVDSHVSGGERLTPVSRARKSILFVGWSNELRGLHVVVRAMQDVIKAVPGSTLTAVGAEEDRHYATWIRAMVNDMNLQDHVNLLGPKPNEEVIRLILESDLVVVPLQWTNEFGPMILVEAMSLAKPVVASNIGAIPELIQDGFNGFLAVPDSPGQFAEKMVWLLKNPELAKTMGEQAQKSVQRLYQNDPTKEILDLYRSAATRGQ